MAMRVIVPSEGGECCFIGEWVHKEGDALKMGDLICQVETDKAAIDIVAPADGILLKILHDTGEEVPALTPIAVVGQPGEQFQDIDSDPQPETPEAKTPMPDKTGEEAGGRNTFPETNEKERALLASPRAKARAAEINLDLSQLKGTGYAGSIIERDILAAAKAQAETTITLLENEIPEAFTVRKLKGVQKITAQKMMESLQQSAQFTLNICVAADAILRMRKQFKEYGKALGVDGITINDLVLYAVARVLCNHAALNSVWSGDVLHEYKHVNLGVAVSTSHGLLVPVIQQADTLTLAALSRKCKTLIQRCRERKQTVEDLNGGTFTVSNLGNSGIRDFTPILNPTQVGILGVGTIVSKLMLREGMVVETHEMILSLTVDHRVIDGEPAAKFLQELRDFLENIEINMAKG